MTTSIDDVVTAKRIDVTDFALTVYLSDGRSISIPLEWYPRLAHATAEEQNDWRLIGGGIGIHWPLIEEDISVSALLEGRKSTESSVSFNRWLAQRTAKG